MYLYDRYALALAMLDGDRDARKVLADLLEEQGERGLAQWARQGSNSKHKQLDFALALLPYRTAIALANGFVLHAFTEPSDIRVLGKLPEQIERWSQEPLEDEGMWAFCRGFLAGTAFDIGSRPRRNGYSNPHLKQVVESLVEAIRCSFFAANRTGDDTICGTPRHFEITAIREVRLVATACRQQTRPDPPRFKRTITLYEIDWQIQRIKAIFQQLLGSS